MKRRTFLGAIAALVGLPWIKPEANPYAYPPTSTEVGPSELLELVSFRTIEQYAEVGFTNVPGDSPQAARDYVMSYPVMREFLFRDITVWPLGDDRWEVLVTLDG